MRPTTNFVNRGNGRYSLEAPDSLVAIEVDRVMRDRSGGLRCELTVRCDAPAASTIDSNVLWSSDLTLSDPRAKSDLVRQLESRLKGPELDWSLLLDRLGMCVRDEERIGEPAILLRDAAKPAPDEQLEVDGLTILKRHPTILFGDGGTAKSYLALYLAGRLDRIGLKVGLFDWELRAEDHRLRLGRLFGEAALPSVVYARCERPLVDEIERLAGVIDEFGLDYIILDSIGFACSDAPEAAEVAADYLRALRSLGIGSLNLAHVTKGHGGDQKPFGSAFWHNGARSTWFVKLVGGKPGDSKITLSLVNRKANLGPRQLPIGFEVQFETDKTTFSRVGLAGVPSKPTIIARVTAALRGGPMTVRELVDALGVKADSVQRAIRRAVKGGQLIRLEAEHGMPIQFRLPEIAKAA